MRAPQGDPGEAGRETAPDVAELLEQLCETVRVLGALVAALRASALRPPVELHVERLEVETLEFRLGDIDVEELQGELNIGITQSLRLAPGASPPEERPPTAQAPSAGPPAGLPGPPSPKRVQLWPPPETEGSDKR